MAPQLPPKSPPSTKPEPRVPKPPGSGHQLTNGQKQEMQPYMGTDAPSPTVIDLIPDRFVLDTTEFHAIFPTEVDGLNLEP